MIIKQFDERVGKLVGRLPQGLASFFGLLDTATSPLVWILLLSMLIVLRIDAYSPVPITVWVLIALPLASTLKIFFRRQRPPTIYTETMKIKSYSFPSSHAYSAALGCGYLFIICTAHGLTLLGGALILLAIIIGISRVHLGAHYPSDVVAGWLLGATVLWVMMTIYL